MSDWISVKDELPKSDYDVVLIIYSNDVNDYAYPYTSDEAQRIAFYSNGHWWEESFPEACKKDNVIADVTHWMPLPAPPE